ncbi:MAG: hypothetical protein LBG42_03340 [Treponema sp.]|jgi:hypothetical protein|nr:hypothetical protein [Treponema sp.]
MSFFCFLWTPLLYLFYRSTSPEDESSGGVWALLLGSVAAISRFFLGSFITPGGFGFLRWLSGFVDFVCVPVLLPLVVYFVFAAAGVFRPGGGGARFALLWLIPAGALRAVGWSTGGNPILLVLVPLLWTSLACGIPFFAGFLFNGRVAALVFSALAILALPFLAATVYWAFFSQRDLLGAALFPVVFAAAVVPAARNILRG